MAQGSRQVQTQAQQQIQTLSPEFFPGNFQFSQKGFSLFSEFIVFAGRSLGRFHPLITCLLYTSPHITDEIKRNVKLLGNKYKFDFVITEIGGTVGDLSLIHI